MKEPPAPYPIYPISDLRDLLVKASSRYRGRVALRTKKDGVYQSMSYEGLLESVRQLAAFYTSRGLGKGDRVALLSENRSEWAVAYLATVAAGMTAVPVDKDLTAREIRHILEFSEPRLLVASGEHLGGRIAEFRDRLRSLETIVCMESAFEGEGEGEGELTFREALALGRVAMAEGDRTLEEAPVSQDEVAAIIFTSGTTGNSKGVMLTQGNLTANITAISQYVSVRDEVLLSVLPLHHTYECTAGFLVGLYQGCTICHAESLRRIPENLKETQATVMLGVPALFEAFYRRIEAGIQEKGERKFRLARSLAAGTERLLGLNIRRWLFRPVHQKLGGRMGLFISGGAAINPDVSRGFRELGVDLIQGYGMTEASPIVSVNRVNHFKDESVGLPLPGVEVRIDQGEILVRGPSVMRGYYLNEEATQEALEDGWLRTGDLGFLDEDGFLHINGRSKSVIVTPNGKNVYPEEIEAVLNQSPFVLESLVWGGPEEDPAKVEVQAIVVPALEAFDQEFGPAQYDEEKMYEVITAEVRRLCQELANYKRVKRILLRPEEFEKTTTRKIKRYLYSKKPKQLAAS